MEVRKTGETEGERGENQEEQNRERTRGKEKCATFGDSDVINAIVSFF